MTNEYKYDKDLVLRSGKKLHTFDDRLHLLSDMDTAHSELEKKLLKTQLVPMKVVKQYAEMYELKYPDFYQNMIAMRKYKKDIFDYRCPT